MSKRPTTREPLSTRLRLPVGRLRDLPIWSKLGLIMIVPIIATVVVGTNGLISNINDANDADRARSLASLSQQAAGMVHELQNERADATILLGSIGGATADATSARTTFNNQVQKTDDATANYRKQRSSLTGLTDDFRGRLSGIDSQLSDLLVMRQQITTGANILGSTVVSRYRTIIDNMLSLRDAAAELSSNAHLGADLRTSNAISDMKEQVSLERAVVLRAISLGNFSAELRKEFLATLAGQAQDEATFRAISAQWHRDLFDKTVAGSDLREAARFEGELTPLTTDTLPPGLFTSREWDNAMVGKSNLLRSIEVELDQHNIDDATAERDLLQRNVLVGTGALLGMLLLAILFAWLVARSMARSLRELRHGALTVAQFGLPQAVARLRDPALSAQMTPQQVALQIAEPLPIRSRDEFGQVAEAFNAVHLEAVRTAAEQAALRASVATMFVNLARRSQILVDRLIGHLDRLERGEEDPDRLAELFQLDHLATRMRRNDENLLVLAGADSTRIQREPAPLMDVLRAAQSEVEHYTRIEFGMIDRDIEISAHSVNDMVHMVAELLDNATAFSPPDSAVMVEARRVGDRTVLLVEDHGIGISPEQLAEQNERLANPPMVDVAVSRMMGLVVVARLAARHSVKVELRPARERGTVADVTLPAGVLVPRALVGRTTSGMPSAGMPAAGAPMGPRDEVTARPVTPAPRSPLVTPLALEGGQGSRSGFGAPPAPAGSGTFGGFGSGGNDRFAGLNGGNDRFGGGNGGNGGYTNGNTPSPAAPPSSPPRGLPAWSDLTGVNGHETPPSRSQSSFGDALPHRRSGESWVDGDPVPEEQSGPIPRQRPEVTDRVAEPPASYTPQAPPAWPPVVSGPPAPQAPSAFQQGPPAQVGPGQVGPGQVGPGQIGPGQFGRPVEPEPAYDPAPPPRSESYAPVDMTAEIPRMRLDWEPAPAQEHAGFDPSNAPQRFVDETMELPIFRELESAWFHTERPDYESLTPNGPLSSPSRGPAGYSPSAGPSVGPSAPVDVRFEEPYSAQARPTMPAPAPQRPQAPAPEYAMPVRGESPRTSTDRPTAPAAVSWQTAADEGWQAASALAESQEFSITDTGLPKRVPMSQLVPGGVENKATTVHRRTPESVRGLLSAYHRGVQRGRTQPGGRSDDPKTPEPTTAGPQNSQGGKEQEG